MFKYKIQNAADFCNTPSTKHRIVEMIEDATKCLKARNFESASWRIQLATTRLEAKNASQAKKDAPTC